MMLVLVFVPVILHGCLDGIFRQNGAMNLYRWQSKFLSDLSAADIQRFVQRFTLDPFGYERTGGDSRTTAISLEAGILNGTAFTDFNLQPDDIATGRRTHHTGADHLVIFVEGTYIARVFVMVQYLVAIRHRLKPQSMRGPLHGVEVDTFLRHLPKRRHITQFRHTAGNCFDGKINFGASGKTSQS